MHRSACLPDFGFQIGPLQALVRSGAYISGCGVRTWRGCRLWCIAAPAMHVRAPGLELLHALRNRGTRSPVSRLAGSNLSHL